MKAYKGFDKNLQCRNFQYEVGKAYTTDKVKLCEHGFHACENPLDVLRFYPLCAGNRYCEVEQSGKTVSDGTKTASTKIKIGEEIGLPGLIEAHFKYTRKKAENGKKCGDQSNLAGGNESKLAGGDKSNLAGGYGSNLAGGDKSNLTGGYGSNLTGGYKSNLTGGYGSTLAGGESSLCVTRNGKAKGGLNSVLVLTSWEWRDKRYTPICVEAIIIDGKKYKSDTWYTLEGGKVVEAE